MKFCVVGSGYVGLSLAVLISQKYEVNLLEIDSSKVELINKKKSPIKKPTGYYFKIMKDGYRQNNFKLQIDL